MLTIYISLSGPAPNQPHGGSGPVQNEEANVEGDEEGEEEGAEEEEIDPKKVMDFNPKGVPLNLDNYSNFVSALGDVAREKIPITHNKNWRNFAKDQEELAKSIWKHIKVNLLFKISTQKECTKID